MAELLKFLLLLLFLQYLINWFCPLCAVVVYYKYHCFTQKLQSEFPRENRFFRMIAIALHRKINHTGRGGTKL